MLKLILAALGLAIAGPALAQLPATVTHPSALVDSTPATPGIIVNKAVTTPRLPVGTVIYPCGSMAAPFVYGVGSAENCPRPAPASSPVDPWAIAPPRMVTPCVAGGGNLAATGRSGVCMDRAMEAYPFHAAAGYDNVVIHDVRLGLVRAMVYNKWQSAWSKIPVEQRPADIGAIRGLTVERVEATCIKYCITIDRVGGNYTFRDLRLRGGPPLTSTGDIPVGIQIGGTASNILVERVHSSGFTTAYPPGHYAQGDSFSNERGVSNVTYRYTIGEDSTDGCYDLKSTNTLLDNTRAIRCNYGYRLWGTGRGTTIECVDNRLACIWVGKNANYTIDTLIVTGSPKLVSVGDRSARLVVRRCIWRGPRAAVLVHGDADVALGEGCRP